MATTLPSEDSSADFNFTDYNPYSFSSPFPGLKLPLIFSGNGEQGRGEDLNEIERTRRGLAAMWPHNDIIAANTNPESLSKSDAADAAAKAADAAAKAADAAAKAADAAAYAAKAAAYAAKAAAVAAAPPRPEELNPKTNAPLDNPTRERGCLSLTNEIEYKILSDKARKAVAYYNKTNKGEEFEFIEIEKFEAVYRFPYWINHLTFMAKPKGKPDSRPKLFFAEVYERLLNFGVYEVKMCMTMDPSGPDVGKGCVYTKSDKDMLHPKGVEFFAGPPGGYSTME